MENKMLFDAIVELSTRQRSMKNSINRLNKIANNDAKFKMACGIVIVAMSFRIREMDKRIKKIENHVRELEEK